jgi:DnaJ-class molecular chaperone
MRFKEYLTKKEMSVKDALEVFGISTDGLSDKIALKRTYRKLAMQYHPDNGGNEEMAKNINNAYEVLSKAHVQDV